MIIFNRYIQADSKFKLKRDLLKLQLCSAVIVLVVSCSGVSDSVTT